MTQLIDACNDRTKESEASVMASSWMCKGKPMVDIHIRVPADMAVLRKLGMGRIQAPLCYAQHLADAIEEGR